MKKQFLFLILFVLAVFGSNQNVFGQVDAPQLDQAIASCPVPVTLTCASAGGALTPKPGEVYTYDIDYTAGSTVQWFVTTDVNVIAAATLTGNKEAASGGQYVLSAGTTTLTGNATYNDATNTGDILEVAWNYFDPGTTVLLVAFVVDGAGCTNNIEAYKIEPMFNFTLDIAALEDDGTVQDPNASKECVSPVQGATFNGTELVMDYGDNYIYYIVTAANWVNSWMPSFTPPTSTGGSDIGTVQWAYSDEATLGAAANWHDQTVPVLASHYGTGVTSIGAEGACIVLRVNIDHSVSGGANNEMLTAETLTMGVDGIMYDASGTTGNEYTNTNLRDLDESADGNAPCRNVTDIADYIINPRPTVTANNPNPFVPKTGL
ncbi:MAG: hypothetical protein ACK5JD_06065 [Mangrovibacterium sp.]